MNDELLKHYTRNIVRSQSRPGQPLEPIIALRRKVSITRIMLDIGISVAAYHEVTGYVGYDDPEQVYQDDLDYIVDHRLALICAAEILDALQAEDAIAWQDWNDTRESAIAATRP